MKRTTFNFGWTVQEGVQDPFGAIFNQGGGAGRPVILPHDAMIEEARSPDAVSGNQYGYYPARSYTYQKTFQVPADWAGQQILLEFEGVMRCAAVYLNNEFIVGHRNGYTGFFADLTPYLRWGENNTVKVLAINEEKSSRWYPGSGIYRDVWLWQGGSETFLPGKQRVRTVSVEEGYAVLQLEGQIANGTRARKLRLQLALTAPNGTPCGEATAWVALQPGQTCPWHTTVTVDAPALWSPDTPALYRAVLRLWDRDTLADETEVTFGIRTLALDARQGLRLNGQTIKLRGACIHHDNGLLGGISTRDAEAFRIRHLKAAGFNAIRSAHNPASKALLDVCDEVGMLVMDELTDYWNESKNANDGALDFAGHWRADVQAMVDKDFNHPSVILYSVGNEVPEIGRVSGAAQCRALAEELRSLDATRYTTFGMNGFLAVTDDLPLFAGMYPKAEEQLAAPSDAGSEELNQVMGTTEQQMLDQFSVSQILTDRLEAAESCVDVVGYNYLTARHELEHRLHPDRVVMGSETYPTEIARLWQIVQRNPHVIGDFTWTGFDYLGEAGIGICHYAPTNGAQGVYPDRLAYCGDFDLNGNRRPVSYLREIAYGLRKDPFLAVERVDRHGQTHDHNSWKYADALDSWTFTGWEGQTARVRVLADCDEVELFLNGQPLGRKRPGEQEALTALYDLPYTPGELLAVAYNAGQEVGRHALHTAGPVAALRVTATRDTLPADGQSLVYLTVDTVDARGRWNRWDSTPVRISVEGAGQLLGFGSAAPSSEESYQATAADTWDGRVMAVIRSTTQPGALRVRFVADSCPDTLVTLTAVPVQGEYEASE